ncbi:MAG: tRNA (adenosine(37)-N6)-dimethylallyltransferase MiaA [Bacteroidetes bacterium]|nr:tRNA (adenosine(37)-N6)-dimethylallyltransferase MiaA [Bacteroidota bacterium]
MPVMPVILGPTACGKTAVAARLAFELDGEVISADSRQVYRGMDIGSGKDLGDYIVEGQSIPYHLIDIAEPGSEYNIFEYQKDFARVYAGITGKGKLPVLCGGSGMYLEAVLKGYSLPEAPADPGFAGRMTAMDDVMLLQELSRLKKLHSTTDTVDRSRMLRALEIELKRRENEITDDAGVSNSHKPHQEREAGRSGGVNMRATGNVHQLIFGLNPGRETVRQRITARLQDRLENGMIGEVERLLEQGIPPERLKAYGLEYKYLTQYLEGKLSYDEMFRLLNIAIHQFAKRQMTWFRRMERQGMKIHWIEGDLPSADKVKKIREILDN